MLPRDSEDFIKSLYPTSLYPQGLSVKGQFLDYSDLTFGERLKLAREGAGLTQEQLADKVGVDQVQVSKWERSTTAPRSNRLESIAAAIGDTQHLNWLLTGKGKPPRIARQAGARSTSRNPPPPPRKIEQA